MKVRRLKQALSNDDGDSNENNKKPIGSISQTTTSSNFFLISRFMEDVDTRTTIFFSVFDLDTGL